MNGFDDKGVVYSISKCYFAHLEDSFFIPFHVLLIHVCVFRLSHYQYQIISLLRKRGLE